MSESTYTFEKFQTQSKTLGLAYVGLYAAAYEQSKVLFDKASEQVKSNSEKANKSFEDYSKNAGELFEELVTRGKVAEADLKVATSKVKMPEMKLPELKMPEVNVSEVVAETNEKIKDVFEPLKEKLMSGSKS